ncbi:MAG: hypothetical protein PHV17_10145 [Candidatus Omnitrophica bacterium]|nr:hypothetical protein [Candidatus Omnitrophota bacterium]
MQILSAVIPVVIVIIFFFFIVRIATIVLKLTGLDENTARFQAISAFTGTGFTTQEAETILADELRRKTVIILMIMGKIGIVSVMASVFFSFGQDKLSNDLSKTFILLIIIVLFYKVTTLSRVNRFLNRFIEKRIIARGIIKQKTMEELFHLPKGYGIAKLTISASSNELGKSLAKAGFIGKNILVLSIEHRDQMMPTAFPNARDVINVGDKLLCYGLLESIKEYA